MQTTLKNAPPTFRLTGTPFTGGPMAQDVPIAPRTQIAARHPYHRTPGHAVRPWKPSAATLQGPMLGQGGFSWNGLIQSIPYNIGGLALMYVGTVLPNPMSAISVIGGMALVGWGLKSMFSGEPEVKKGEDFQGPTVQQFPLIKATIVKPRGNEEVDLGFWSGDYDVEILWTNQGNKPAAFAWDIYVREEYFGLWGGKSDVKSGIVYSGTMKLPADIGQKIEPLELDLLSTGLSTGVWGAAAVSLQVRKYDSAGRAHIAAEKKFVVTG